MVPYLRVASASCSAEVLNHHHGYTLPLQHESSDEYTRQILVHTVSHMQHFGEQGLQWGHKTHQHCLTFYCINCAMH